jgi:hypothetical protein
MGQQRPRSSETAPGLGSILPRWTACQKGDQLLDEGIAVSLGRARRPAEAILAHDTLQKPNYAGQRVVRLGEKPDLPIFVLLASAPS